MPEWFPLQWRPDDEEPAATIILLKNARIFDGKSEELTLAPTDVLVRDNMIDKVGVGLEAPVEEDKKVAVVDCSGKTLMPGLIDMHSHLCLQEGMLEGRDSFDMMAMGAMCAQDCMDYLQQGFTTCRDAGGNVLGISKAVRTGRIPGPRIYACGAFISQTGGHGDTGCCFDQPGDMDVLEKNGFAHIVDGVPEVLKAVRNNFRNGATQIKVMAGGGCASAFDPIHMTQLTFEEMKAACDIAKDYGSYVMAHAYHDDSINRFLDAGGRCIEHGFLMSETTMARIAREGVALCVQAVMSLEAFAEPEAITFFTKQQKTKAAMVNAGALKMMQLARKHKPLIISGGDMFGRNYQHRQVDNIIAMVTLGGFDNVTALKSATGNAGIVLGWTTGMNPYPYGKIGVIEEGAYADIIIVNGNPLEDITCLKRNNVEVVIKDGKTFKYSLSDGALSVVNQ